MKDTESALLLDQNDQSALTLRLLRIDKERNEIRMIFVLLICLLMVFKIYQTHVIFFVK